MTKIHTPIGFDPPLWHDIVDGDWPIWGHQYLGDIYGTYGVAPSILLTMPPNTKAFYFDALAGQGEHGGALVTATANDGTSSGPVAVKMTEGAKYFGFYVTDPNQSILYIEVKAESPGGGPAVLIIGEFGINCGLGDPLPVVGGVSYPWSAGVDPWGWAAVLPALAALGIAFARRRR